VRLVAALALRIGLCLLLFGIAPAVHAQPKPSFSASYEVFPFQNFKDPEIGLRDAKVHTNVMSFGGSYPLVFSQGKTILVNELFYQRRDFDYKDFPEGDPALNHLHAAHYMLMLQQTLSEKWSLWALVMPGLASDLEAKLSIDDFNLQAAAIFVRQFSERFSLGFGAAYSTLFGVPLPLPVLVFDWNNGSNLKAEGSLPSNLEFWYRPGPVLDLGLLLEVDGNNYRGDPSIYEVPNPEFRYSVLTFGPASRIHLSQWLHLLVKGGMLTSYHFEFWDGNDKVGTFNLKPSGFLAVGLQFGG
jgi:hypothetical protein